ncbi:phospho-2-dehydro-3-deoxyheptonate aldolase [Pasteurella multocida subsp. gallicida str. Anand1_poultry]|nr:phospho-2-dehydro-3-deoxyheptonate aldolase [Pasteurella multocida subsp. gallicida str. Anand1_poultry]
MNKDNIHNVNIVGEKVLITPKELKEKLPLSLPLRSQIAQSRRDIANIIHKKVSVYGCDWTMFYS